MDIERIEDITLESLNGFGRTSVGDLTFIDDGKVTFMGVEFNGEFIFTGDELEYMTLRPLMDEEPTREHYLRKVEYCRKFVEEHLSDFIAFDTHLDDKRCTYKWTFHNCKADCTVWFEPDLDGGDLVIRPEDYFMKLFG